MSIVPVPIETLRREADLARGERKAPLAAGDVPDAGGEHPDEGRRGPVLPTALDLAALAQLEPPQPRAIIREMLPVGYATLLAADGGTGKSQLALYLAVHVALGRPVWGLEVVQTPVAVFSFEDRADVLHWRLARICRHLGVEMAALAGRLHVFDGVDSDATMFAFDPRDGARTTVLHEWARERIDALGVGLAVIDGVSDVNAASENDRAAVKGFVRAMMRLVGADGALLLISHVNRETASVGGSSGGSRTGYSGSTAWNNAVRARWYLRAATAEEGAGPGRKELVLELQKSNLGPDGRKVHFAWDDDAHLFLPTGKAAADPRADANREGQLHDWVVRACDESDAAGNPIPATFSGSRTAPSVLGARADCPPELKGRFGSRRLVRIIEELRGDRRLIVDSRRNANRHYRDYLVVTARQVGLLESAS